jgi:hypothetical protein
MLIFLREERVIPMLTPGVFNLDPIQGLTGLWDRVARGKNVDGMPYVRYGLRVYAL